MLFLSLQIAKLPITVEILYLWHPHKQEIIDIPHPPVEYATCVMIQTMLDVVLFLKLRQYLLNVRNLRNPQPLHNYKPANYLKRNQHNHGREHTARYQTQNSERSPCE